MLIFCYSFAIVLWEIVTRQLPFDHYRFNYEVLDAVCTGERPTLPDDCEAEMKTLIKDCWNGTPTERPSFQHIEERLSALQEATEQHQ